MSNEYSVTIPARTSIGASAFANAGNIQEIVISVDGAPVARFAGSGTNNKHLGSSVFNSGSGHVSVKISAAGRPSKVTGAQMILMNKLNFVTIGSEDAGDNDYNDGIVILNWPLG